jgi:two-component system KDP operon response regulator KdpE
MNSGSGSRNSILKCDYLTIDFDKHEVTVDGKRVDLSPTEFRLLSVMARHQGRMLPHEFLLNEVWGQEYIGEIDYLRLYISYLRRKIEKDSSKPSLIHNEWGIGYRFG